MWVDKENWLALKIESYNELGNLERTMNVLKLGEFDGMVVADVTVADAMAELEGLDISFPVIAKPDRGERDEADSPCHRPGSRLSGSASPTAGSRGASRDCSRAGAERGPLGGAVRRARDRLDVATSLPQGSPVALCGYPMLTFPPA